MRQNANAGRQWASTGVSQEEEAVSEHRSLLPRIMIIVTIKVKAIVRRQ
jgi:hypothetical protein